MNRRSFMVALAVAATPAAAFASRVTDALAARLWFEARMKDEDADLKCSTDWYYDTANSQWHARATCKNKGTKSRSATVEGELHVDGGSNKFCENTQTISKKSTRTFDCHVKY